MDSLSVELFTFGFHSGIELGANLMRGVLVVAVLVITAKLTRII